MKTTTTTAERRAALREYSRELTNLELLAAAEQLLEGVSTATAERVLPQLAKDRLRCLKRMDAAAARLGVPS